MPTPVSFRFRPPVPLFAACACLVIAGTSLFGWLSGMTFLTSVFPGLPSMVPLTACMTLLAASTLVLHTRAASKVTAAAVIAIALTVLALYAVAQWRGMPGAVAGHPAPWTLPSPLTAILFLATGSALALLPSARHVYHAQWLALGVFFMSLLTLAGYLFRGTTLYLALPGTGTAILTALVLALLAVGTLAARPAAGIMAALDGHGAAARLARQLISAAIAMPLLLGSSVWLALRLALVDTDTAIALLVWGIAAALVAITWHGALHLKRADGARRNAELALEQALSSLREADANKDRFMAVLAHELRNPLAPIRASAELLHTARAVDAARQQRLGSIILRQVGHMTDLVEDLLDMSSVRQGLLTVERMPVDVRKVVDAAMEQVMSLIAERGQTLDTDLTADPAVVLGDYKRLVQVVANLLVNATKFTPDGGTIFLALRVREQAIEISVSDNGIGMAPASLELVFESFAQVARATGRAAGGLGIGLALVRSLVHLHGGTVTASSKGLGCGSTFSVRLAAHPQTTA